MVLASQKRKRECCCDGEAPEGGREGDTLRGKDAKDRFASGAEEKQEEEEEGEIG